MFIRSRTGSETEVSSLPTTATLSFLTASEEGSLCGLPSTAHASHTYTPLVHLQRSGCATFRVQPTPTSLMPGPTGQLYCKVGSRPAACVPAGWPDPCPEPSFLLQPLAVWQNRVSASFPFSHRGVTVSMSQNCLGTQVPGVWDIPRFLLLSSWHI